MLKTRKMAVSGRFYPAEKEELDKLLDEIYKKAKPKSVYKAIGAVCPHAGIEYSGVAAASLFRSIKVPGTVVIFSPNHTGMGDRCALSSDDLWKMPFGEVEVEKGAADELISKSKLLKYDTLAHVREHSVEVLLPFIHRANPKAKIIPITLSKLSFKECEILADEMVSFFEKNENVLFLASSDMNHFEDSSTTMDKDKLAIDAILGMDAKALYDTVHDNEISMCGVLPVIITILISQKLNAKFAKLIHYYNSGDITGDKDSVVGYLAVAFDL